MDKATKYREKSKIWHEKHAHLTPKVGEPAPDFSLCDTNGELPIQLSDFKGKKPVALVFGSFT